MAATVDVRTCTSCGARIFWAITLGGKRMPIDVEPRADGNVVPVLDAEQNRRVKVLHGDELPHLGPGPAFVAHFTTCPNAAVHRARRAQTSKAGRCQLCRQPLDPWLVERGEVHHVNCKPLTAAEIRAVVDETSPAVAGHETREGLPAAAGEPTLDLGDDDR